MMVLSVDHIEKRYTDQKLLEDISFILHEKDKIGVIGVNGTGKSTLLKIIAGLEQADAGSITTNGEVHIAYLEQTPDFSQPCTVFDYVMNEAKSMKQEIMEYEVKTILTKLKLTDFAADVRMMSGGQKKRVALACVLVRPCDVLILDEPTNHLDQDMVLWLEQYLMKSTKTILMVTHDRYFLEQVCNRMIEIDHGKLYSYDANYSQYLELKEKREEVALANERKRQSILRKELAWIRRGAMARTTKSKERIQRFEQLSAQDGVVQDDTLHLSSLSRRLGKKTIELHQVSKAFDGQTLIENFSFNLPRLARIGIVGMNGIGKSTLLNLMAGRIQPDQGHVEIGETVQIGYVTQEALELDLDMRVIDYVKDIGEVLLTLDGEVTASQMLERFLFPPHLQYNKIGRLSGGERRRLYLLGILMSAPNILLLDEPTNDLDIQTLTILEEYLDVFAGAVIAVSHDRYFLDKIMDELLIFTSSGIERYLGEYSEYLNIAAAATKATKEVVKKQEQEERKQSKKVKLSFQEQKELEQLEGLVVQLEEQLQSLDKQLEQETNGQTLLELSTKRQEVDALLEEKTERWMQLQEIKEGNG